MRWLGLVVILGLAGCNHWVETQTPLPQLLEEAPPPRLRLETRSGESMVMVGTRLRGDTLVGRVERQSGGEAVMSAVLGSTVKHLVPATVAVRDLVRVEARRSHPAATFALAAGVGAGLVSVVIISSQFDNWGNGNAMVYRIPF